MTTSNASVTTTGSSANSSNSGFTSTSAIENDDIVYGCPEPDPKPDKNCCCKTYHIVLHFS